MFQNLFGKYKNIVVSIVLFLLLDASVLILNFYISFQISEDASGVNISGRQRMLSQRISKSLFDIDYSIDSIEEKNQSLKELTSTVSLFDNTLNAFDNGGKAPGASGEMVSVLQVDTQKSRLAIVQAKTIWKPYKKMLDAVVNASDNPRFKANLLAAIEYSKKYNIELLRLMNDLTVELEAVASARANRLRIIQTVGISLAIINFFIIMFHFLRQLKDSDAQVEKARNETLEILNTVNEGLFLLDKENVISSQYSSVLEDMFDRKDIGGLTLEGLLGNIVSNKDLETANRFVALLFKEDIKSNLIKDLNPLSKVEVNLTDDHGQFKNKFFSFSFERVYSDGHIKDILVTVNDITERVFLERELALTKEQGEQQIEVLTSILHVNPVLLKPYVQDVFASLSMVNTILKEPSKSSSGLRKKLNDIHIEIHRVKGEGAALGLQSFEQIAHDFELNIQQVQKKENIIGDDFLPLVVKLEKLVKHTESVRALTEKLVSFSSHSNQESLKFSTQWDHLKDLTKTVAGRQNKKVSLVTSGLSENHLPDDVRSLINDLAIQGIRNAIVHGIETPRERQTLGKKDTGRIDLRLASYSDSSLELSISDDGSGIDSDRIRKTAIKTGMCTAKELDSFNKKQLVSLIFESGFSTASTYNKDAGGGVGMGVIKQRVKAIGGKIRVQSRHGIGTKISVFIPLLPVESELAA